VLTPAATRRAMLVEEEAEFMAVEDLAVMFGGGK